MPTADVMVNGPGSPFELLLPDPERPGTSLPAPFRAIYGGDWRIPPPTSRPYIASCFVTSHDGRISFAVPGHEGGGDISGFDAHDQWIMGLLRARSDAVSVGANTLRVEPEHVWTPGYICPRDATAFEELRRAEGRRQHPLQVLVTRRGDLPVDARIFAEPDLDIVVLTTARGAAEVRARVHDRRRVDVVTAGDTELDLDLAHRTLLERHGVERLLCEGGPRVYGAMVQAGQIDEEFLTWSPVVVGGSDDTLRPGLLEGAPFAPAGPARVTRTSVRRAGDHLFVRGTYTLAG